MLIPYLSSKIMRKTLLIFFLIGSAWAQTSYQSLDIAYHVRSLGMSGSGVADVLGADVSSLNPALLSGKEKTLILSAVRYPATVQSQLAEWRMAVKGLSVAATFRGVNYGNFKERDRDGNDLGSFSAGDAWLNVAVAKSLSPLADVGISAGMFQSSVGDVTAVLGLVSLGGRVTIPQLETSLGVSVRNLGTTVQEYTSYTEMIPTSVAVGVTRKMEYLPLILSADAVWWEKRSLFRLGGEFALPKGLFLQLGTSSFRSDLQTGELWRDIASGFSLGFGYSLQRVSVGFAVANSGVGGMSLGVGFSRRF